MWQEDRKAYYRMSYIYESVCYLPITHGWIQQTEIYHPLQWTVNRHALLSSILESPNTISGDVLGV